MAPSRDQDRLIPTVAHWGAYLARVRDGKLIALEPNPADSDPSPIGGGIVRAVTSAARIGQPMVRKGYLEGGPKRGGNPRGREPFVAVSWEQATKLAADAIRTTRREYGSAAVFAGSYGWASAGRFHHANSQIHRFMSTTGGYTAAVNSYSKGALEVILPHVVGEAVRDTPDSPTWGEIAEHSKLVIAFGGLPFKNTQMMAGGILDHGAKKGLEDCRRAKVKFVTIGAQRDDMADAVGAHWISIRPGTDAAFMLGLAHAMIEGGKIDDDFLARCCVGFARLRDYVLGRSDGVAKAPLWAANICGCDAGDIAKLARDIVSTRALITVMWAVQRGDHGEQPCWLAIALAAMGGSMGKPGGGVGFGYPQPFDFARAQARVRISPLPRDRNHVREALPVARLSDALLNPGATIDYDGTRYTYPTFRVVYWAGGNPFHHHQDINRMVRAWAEPETIVIHDSFWTAAARHADIVLPATTPLERNDIAYGNGRLMAMHKAIEPVGQSRNDFDIFSEIADHLGYGEAFTEGRDEMAWLRWMYGETQASGARANITLPDFDQFWREGLVAFQDPPRGPPRLASLRESPETRPLLTPSGKIELFSEKIASFQYDDAPGHGVWLEPVEWLGSDKAKQFPIHLLSNQPKTRLHSQYDGGDVSQRSKVQGREPIRLNPTDAAKRGIKDGDVVRVFNDRGQFLAGAVVTAVIREKVAQIATGAWYDPVGPGGLDVHGNPNVVTIDKGTSKLAQATSAQSCLVEIEKFTGELPPVMAFTPPQIV